MVMRCAFDRMIAWVVEGLERHSVLSLNINLMHSVFGIHGKGPDHRADCTD